MNKKFRLLSAACLGLAVAVTAGNTSAFAVASGHPITGTCFENGRWFTSSNVRTMGGTYIQANFSTLPSHGLAFQAKNYNTGAKLGSTIYAPPDGTQTLYSGGRRGTEFVNMFRLQVSGHQDNYSFDGSEIY